MPPARPKHVLGALRGVRAAILALAALLLAGAAHVAGGGRLPSVPALALRTVPLAWGAVAMTGRTRGRTAILGSLAVAQLALHEAFMVLAGPGCASAGGAGIAGMGGIGGIAGMAGMGGMGGMSGASLSCPVSGVPGMAGMAAAGPGLGAMGGRAFAGPDVMLAAHLVATVAAALLLAYGERLLAALPGLMLAHRARRAAAAVVPVLPRPARLTGTGCSRPPREVAGGTVRRRGPPRAHGVPVPA